MDNPNKYHAKDIKQDERMVFIYNTVCKITYKCGKPNMKQDLISIYLIGYNAPIATT